MTEKKTGFDLAAALGAVSNLGTSAQEGRKQIEYVDIALMDEDARNFYQLSDVEKLAANIQLFGLQQPLVIRPNPETEGRYIIVSGHRRFAALRLLAKENAGKFGQAPCIVERAEISPALEELRLIYANSDTRKMSSAELNRQTQRVEELLYQLKEEGHEFPGRMRDHVAEACKVSKSKLARLKVIREKLIEELCGPYKENVLNESEAYAFAQLPADHQRKIYAAELKKNGHLRWINQVRIESRGKLLAQIAGRACKKSPGETCSNVDGKFAHLTGSSYSYDNCQSKCCAKCEKLGTCKNACPKLAEKIKVLKADAKEQRKQEQLAQEERDRSVIAEIQKYWNRFGEARAMADKSIKECAKAMGIDVYALGNEDEVMAKECLEFKFKTSTYLPYGYSCYLSEVQRYVRIADLLGCSLDYLLCRTDVREMAGLPQPVGQLVFAGWMPGGTTPADPCDVVAEFDLGETRSKKLCRWTGREFTFPNGSKIDLEPIKWMALPADEEESV